MTDGREPLSNAKTGDVGSVPPPAKHYMLRLYVTGSTPHSVRAITNIRTFCETYLEASYDLEIHDLSQNPGLAEGEQIIAAPTLIKSLPLPLRRLIGDMSNTERMLLGLDIKESTAMKPATTIG